MSKFVMLTSIVLVLGLTFSTHPLQAKQNSEVDDKTEIITVHGTKPYGFYRQKMVELKYAFFDLHNSLNDNEDLKIHCNKKSFGGRIRVMVCEPQYVIDARIKLDQEKRRMSKFTRSMLTQTTDRELNAYLKDWHAKADAEKLRLMQQHPSLKALFLELIEAENNYKRTHAETFGRFSNFYQDPDEKSTSSREG
ncbi:hypothetical protein [Paraglaciecola aestuariivivens]